MRRFIISGLLTSLFLISSLELAFADYQLTQLSSAQWNGTTADRLQAETAGSYQFDYGEEANVSFTLPWNFSFYGINYTQITADSDGNIWFGAVGSGPRIAVWNTELNSYYVGGVFVEHKTAPERVVVQWLTATAVDAGYGRNNSFEAILFLDGTIQFNYQTISSYANTDSGSGITDGTVSLNLPASVPTLAGTSFEFSIVNDADGDGVLDSLDNCPNTDNPDQLDFDNDGQGDLCDTDDDNDTVEDLNDGFPLDASEWADTDADGVGNNADTDDDNDLMPDSWEISYSLDPLSAADAVLDGDLDGLDNIGEFNVGADPTNSDTDGDGLLDGNDPYPADAPAISLSQASILASENAEVLLLVETFVVPGGNVLIEQIADIDFDGAVDSGEPVIRRLQQVDTDADGSMSTILNMLNALAVDHATGNYLFRISSGSNSVLQSFTVDSVSQVQTLQGQITDGVNGVAGAQVQLLDKWQRPVAWAITDVNGNYLFQVPEAGGYYLLPQAEGYAFDRNTASLITVVASGAITAPDVEMVSGANIISGQVVSGTTALAGIQVVTNGSLGNDYFARTLTAADGSYSFSLPAGDYTIQVVADSYAGPSIYGCLADVTTDAALSVNGYQGGVDFALPTAAVVASGVVTDEATMPIAGVSVVAISNDEIVAMAVTASDGSYRLPLKNNSSYTVALESDVATVLGYVGQQITVQTVTSDVTGQNLPAHSIESWITGTVTDESSTPLTVLPVHLRSGDDLYSLSTNTTVDGEYLFGAFAGTWFVRAGTEAQGFIAATESEVILLSGQTGQVDFVATNFGGDESCNVCHSVMTESTTCLDCHDLYQSQHHAEAQSPPWSFDCMDCHVFAPSRPWYPTIEECVACHISLDPEKPTVEDIHHNLTP